MTALSKVAQHLAAALALLAAAITPAAAEVPEFYAGKTLTIVVGLDAGGTVDTFVRQFAIALKKHMPGKPNILVQNMPGAGGLLSTNWLMERATRDGLAIIYQPWDPLAQALGNQGLRARYEQFEFVSGIGDTRVVYARVDSVPGGIRKPADIMKADGIAVGALTNTDISGLVAKLAMEVLGVRHKFITGYRGGQDIFLGMQRGEVQVHNTSLGTFRTRGAPFIKSGAGIGIAYLVSMDRDGRFETDPLITEMPPYPELYREIHGKLPSGASWDALNWLTQQFSDLYCVGLAPPGTPPAAVAALRRGMELASTDPEFSQASIKANGLPYAFVTVDRGRAIFKALAETKPAVLDTVRRSIGEVK